MPSFPGSNNKFPLVFPPVKITRRFVAVVRYEGGRTQSPQHFTHSRMRRDRGEGKVVFSFSRLPRRGKDADSGFPAFTSIPDSLQWWPGHELFRIPNFTNAKVRPTHN